PFGDVARFGSEIAGLLTDEPRRQRLRERAYADGRSMIWQRGAENYLSAFESARRSHRLRVVARPDIISNARDSHTPPEMRIGHLLSMCDDTGQIGRASCRERVMRSGVGVTG